MNNDKLKVAIVFGGRSTEHQISLLSATNVYESLDKEKYDPILIGIDKSGQWHLNGTSINLTNRGDANKVSLPHTTQEPLLISQNTGAHSIISADGQFDKKNIDVIFPVLHGTYGEDGSIQGLAKLADLPCVGCNIVGSAVGMDKDIMKHVLRSNGIEVAPWITVRRGDAEYPSYNQAQEKLGSELFLKPANLGSSVGVSYCNSEVGYNGAIKEALLYDDKLIIESKVVGREVECAILGNQNPKASLPGEVVPREGFYSFENKYLDEKGAALHIPAKLSDEQISAIQELAIKTYKVLECRGMSRVDMFMTEQDELIINEINTIPGFTNISMYPKLWECTGLPQKELITRLIELAIEEHQAQSNLKL